MKRKTALLGAAVTLCLLPTAANATTLYATSLYPQFITDFSIEYTDSNGNNLLDLGEITGFSGVTTKIVFTTITFDTVIALAGLPGFTNSNGSFWIFDRSSDPLPSEAPPDKWTYSITNVEQVPLPAALPLLAAGLGALAVFGRRRKRKALAVSAHW